jgi:hypothetical protein
MTARALSWVNVLGAAETGRSSASTVNICRRMMSSQQWRGACDVGRKSGDFQIALCSSPKQPDPFAGVAWLRTSHAKSHYRICVGSVFKHGANFEEDR